MKDQRIIVIGGSSGIGFAVARMAFQLGARVTLTSRNPDRARLAAGNIGASVKGLALDVDHEPTVTSFFDAHSAIDHLYLAAGTTRVGSLTEGTLEENMAAFNTRLMGSLRVVRAAIGKIQPGGSVTFTGGLSTDRPIAGAWVSGLGTASVEQLARVLVMEFPSVRFNAVSPGYTDTPMWDSIMGVNKADTLAGIAQMLPVKKIASPEEVASAVLFLMSNASVTGEIIHVDGGGRLV